MFRSLNFNCFCTLFSFYFAIGNEKGGNEIFATKVNLKRVFSSQIFSFQHDDVKSRSSYYFTMDHLFPCSVKYSLSEN